MLLQIDSNLNVKLFDFKFSTRVGGTIIPFGPLKVIAPEVFRDFESSFESDAFQLGCFFLGLVTRGGLPFPELTNEKVAEKRITGVRLTPKVPRCAPAWLATLISRLVKHNAADRSTIATAWTELTNLGKVMPAETAAQLVVTPAKAQAAVPVGFPKQS